MTQESDFVAAMNKQMDKAWDDYNKHVCKIMWCKHDGEFYFTSSEVYTNSFAAGAGCAPVGIKTWKMCKKCEGAVDDTFQSFWVY